ncbi:hypothetical protein ACHAXS_007734 [Conticribra weissflogii]
MAVGKHKQKADDDWIASLAKQATADDVGFTALLSNNTPTTTEERIQRRERKRLDRDERKRAAAEARFQKKAKKQKLIGNKNSELNPSFSSTVKHGGTKKNKFVGGITQSSKEALNRLSEFFKTIASDVMNSKPKTNAISPKNSDGELRGPELVNGIPVSKGKATKFSTIRPDSKELQPRIRDYNGQGLVRPSLFLSLSDPSFVPKLEMEFEEHVPGFFGRAKAKSAKKQSDVNMLWRRRLEEKVAEDSVKNTKKKKKKMQVDLQRELEAVIRGSVM